MLVPGVGILFEAYYYLHGTERDRKIYDTFYIDNKMVDQQYRDLLLRRFAQPFAAYVASLALTRTRGRCKTPMFYISLVDDYFGLSNRGFVARAHCNMGLSLKSIITEEDQVGESEAGNWLTQVDATRPPLIFANRAVGGLSIL